MAKKEELQEFKGKKGVWRTIGGRKVFIATGQSLGEAMKESGKFDNIRSKNAERKSENIESDKNVQSVKDFRKKLRGLENYSEELDIGDDVIIKTGAGSYGVRAKWDESDPMTDYSAYTYGFKEKWLIDRYKQKGLLSDEAQTEKAVPKKTIYNAQGKTDSTYIKDAVKQEANKQYEYKDAYKTYKEKFNKTWGEKGESEKSAMGSMYTNNEFMEHLEDANWHTERRMLLDAKLTEKQLEYVKNNTEVGAWSVGLDKKKTEQLINEAKIKYPKEINPTKYSVTSASISRYQNMFNEYKKLHPNTKMDLQKFAKMMMDLG